MPEPTRLVLIRHGEARGAIEGVVAGHAGCQGLTDLGRRQTGALRDRLLASGSLEAGAVYTSILPRAIETAEILAPALSGLKAEQDCDLCELHPGVADGVRWEEFRERYAFDMRAEPERPMSPGGDSLVSFQQRVERRIERIVADHPGQTSVVVCHGGVITAATLALMELAMHRPRPFRLEPQNTSLTEWVLAPGSGPGSARWVLHRYNDAAHLDALEPQPR